MTPERRAAFAQMLLGLQQQINAILMMLTADAQPSTTRRKPPRTLDDLPEGATDGR